ncbi:MAG: hypothetical protein AB7F86_00885 [Bdellovibrionales bacterium]
MAYWAGLVLWAVGLPRPWMAAIALLAVNRWPQFRQEILGGTFFLALALSFCGGERGGVYPALALCALLWWFWFLVELRGHWSAFRRHPVALHTIFFLCGLVAAESLRFHGNWSRILWLAVTLWTHLFCYFTYALMAAPRGMREQLLALSFAGQMFNPSPVPKGKNWNYLEKVWCLDPEERMTSRLKGVKLLIWAALLYFGGEITKLFVEGVGPLGLHMPTQQYCLAAASTNQPCSVLQNWAHVGFGFVFSTLEIAVPGHLLVGFLRLAGYRLPRNMYRPFESLTIAQFWNRYYYYFKELLADFYFYPTFDRLSRWPTRWRVVAATFAAAGFGNFFVHFLFHARLQEQSLGEALRLMRSYSIYVLVLSAGIAISQWRSLGGRKRPQSFGGKWRARILVIGFYVVLSTFDTRWATGRLTDNFNFWLALFSLR